MEYKPFFFIFLMSISVVLIKCEKNYTGVPDPNVEERIYNGFTASWGMFPFQAYLNAPQGDGSYSFCGGSLIHPDYVLTAGHCVYNHNTIIVVLGILNVQTMEGAWKTYASWIYLHPNYNYRNLDNDIAILKLAQSAPSTANIRTIALPGWSQRPITTFDNYYAVVSGWGRTYNTQNGENPLLQYQRLHVMYHSDCRRVLYNFNIDDYKICTDKQVASGPCQGDSGGPVSLWLDNNQPLLIGIVSFRVGECVNNNPEVYTATASYLDYISQVTGMRINN